MINQREFPKWCFNGNHFISIFNGSTLFICWSVTGLISEDFHRDSKEFNIIPNLYPLVSIKILISDWDNDDRPRNWKDIRDKWAECPRQFRMLEAPYCYRYWRYFVDLDPWFGRSITDNSRNDWYAGGWGIRDVGRKPIRRMRHRKDKDWVLCTTKQENVIIKIICILPHKYLYHWNPPRNVKKKLPM